jgi:hypothetical protein
VLKTKLKAITINSISCGLTCKREGQDFSFVCQVIEEYFADKGSPQVFYYAFCNEDSSGSL